MSSREPALRIVATVHRTAHQLAVYIASMRGLGLTQGEAHILALLCAGGAATIADLHRAFAHRRSTLTSILDRLAARGLVRRDVGKSDRRTFMISLTASGRSLGRRTLRELRRVEHRALSELSAADLSGFERVTEALARALTRKAKNSPFG